MRDKRAKCECLPTGHGAIAVRRTPSSVCAAFSRAENRESPRYSAPSPIQGLWVRARTRSLNHYPLYHVEFDRILGAGAPRIHKRSDKG